MCFIYKDCCWPSLIFGCKRKMKITTINHHQAFGLEFCTHRQKYNKFINRQRDCNKLAVINDYRRGRAGGKGQHWWIINWKSSTSLHSILKLYAFWFGLCFCFVAKFSTTFYHRLDVFNIKSYQWYSHILIIIVIYHFSSIHPSRLKKKTTKK